MGVDFILMCMKLKHSILVCETVSYSFMVTHPCIAIVKPIDSQYMTARPLHISYDV